MKTKLVLARPVSPIMSYDDPAASEKLQISFIFLFCFLEKDVHHKYIIHDPCFSFKFLDIV